MAVATPKEPNVGLQREAAKSCARAAIMQVGHEDPFVRVADHVVATQGDYTSKVEVVRKDRGVRTDELRRADGELVVHYAPEPVWYSMSTGERVVLGWLADGTLKPHVDSVFPLEEAEAALNKIAARNVKGKVLLKL